MHKLFIESSQLAFSARPSLFPSPGEPPSLPFHSSAQVLSDLMQAEATSLQQSALTPATLPTPIRNRSVILRHIISLSQLPTTPSDHAPPLPLAWLSTSAPTIIPAKSQVDVTVTLSNYTTLPPHVTSIEVGNLIGETDSLSPLAILSAFVPLSFASDSEDPSAPASLSPRPIHIPVFNTSDADYLAFTGEIIGSAFPATTIAPAPDATTSSLKFAADFFVASQLRDHISAPEAFPPLPDPSPALRLSVPRPLPPLPIPTSSILAAAQAGPDQWHAAISSTVPTVIIAPGLTQPSIDGTIASDGRRISVVATIGPGGSIFPFSLGTPRIQHSARCC